MKTSIDKLEAEKRKLDKEIERLKLQCEHPFDAIQTESIVHHDDYGSMSGSSSYFVCTDCGKRSLSWESGRGWDNYYIECKPVYKKFTKRDDVCCQHMAQYLGYTQELKAK